MFWRSLLVSLMCVLPLSGQDITYIQACLFVERGNPTLLFDYDKSSSAIRLAVEYANEQILPEGYILRTHYTDAGSECSMRTDIVRLGLDLWLDKKVVCDAYIGPGCGMAAENLHDLATYFNIPVIGIPAADVGYLAPSGDYKLLVRISITFSSVATVIISFCDDFNYTTPYFFQDSSDKFYNPMGSNVKLTIQLLRSKKNDDLFYTSNFDSFDGSAQEDDEILRKLQRATLESRVIVVFANASTTRRFMLLAAGMGMAKGDYVFVAVELYKSDVWGDFKWKMSDDSDQLAFAAYQPLMLIALDQGTSTKTADFIEQANYRSRDVQNRTLLTKKNVDPVVTHFYDAVILYATGVKLLVSQGHDYRDGIDVMNNFSFTSPLNGIVQLDRNADRQMPSFMLNPDPKYGKFEIIFGFPSGTSDVNKLGTIGWPNGNSYLPPNTPRCGFRGDARQCQNDGALSSSSVAGTIVAVLLILTVVGALFYYYVLKRNQLDDPYWWRIPTTDLYSVNTTSMAAKSTASSTGVMSTTKLSTTLTAEQSLGKSKTPSAATTASAKVKTAQFLGAPVHLTELPEPKIKPPPGIVREAALARYMQHNNIQRMQGVGVSDEMLCTYVIGDLCQKGSLTDLIKRKTMRLDWPFRHSLMKDIAAGLSYLHTSPVLSHGWLTSDCCLIDSRFVLRISDFAFTVFRDPEDLHPPINAQQDRDFEILLWRAPELLRRRMEPRGTQTGDVYSFAILLQQIYLRSMPFRSKIADEHDSQKIQAPELVMEVKHGAIPPLRPRVPMSAVTPELYNLMDACWEEDPRVRPVFVRIRDLLRKTLGKSGDNVIDHLIHSLEMDTTDLEEQLRVETKHFLDERQRSADLLASLLPKSIATSLERSQMVQPETFASATVLYFDIANFGKISQEATSPSIIVQVLQTLYSTMDDVLRQYSVWKILSFVDTSMVVSGAPVPNGSRHAYEMCLMIIALRREISATNVKHLNVTTQIAFALPYIPVAASEVLLEPSYRATTCRFGEAVSTALQLLEFGELGRILVTSEAKTLVDKLGGFAFLEKGGVPATIVGKGVVQTFWLIGSD